MGQVEEGEHDPHGDDAPPPAGEDLGQVARRHEEERQRLAGRVEAAHPQPGRGQGRLTQELLAGPPRRRRGLRPDFLLVAILLLLLLLLLQRNYLKRKKNEC